MSRHMYLPFAGYTLNGESFHPCFWKIGPSKNGRHTSVTPAARAASGARETARYEYVLASSNHTARSFISPRCTDSARADNASVWAYSFRMRTLILSLGVLASLSACSSTDTNSSGDGGTGGNGPGGGTITLPDGAVVKTDSSVPTHTDGPLVTY